MLLFPIVAFFVMFPLWWFKGRDRSFVSHDPSPDPPDELPPALCVATFQTGSMNMRFLTATLLDLAVRGHINFHLLSGTIDSIVFGRGEVPSPSGRSRRAGEPRPYEEKLLERMFEYDTQVDLAKLRERRFYLITKKFYGDVQAEMETIEAFERSPVSVQLWYIFPAILIASILFFAFGPTGPAAFTALLTGAIIGGFGYFMPRRTVKGSELFGRVAGFKKFLIQGGATSAIRTNVFFSLLPYAVAFSVKDAWAERFALQHIAAPDWIHGMQKEGSTSIAAFIQELHLALLHLAIVRTPSSEEKC